MELKNLTGEHVLDAVDTVLEVGTESIDGHYPRFVASFKPENMSTNSHLTRKEN